MKSNRKPVGKSNQSSNPKSKGKSTTYLLTAGAVAVIAIALWRYGGTGSTTARIEEIVVPDLSAAARVGEVAFNENCASCHGPNAAGTDKGPPLVHDIYNPGHHADAAFHLAVIRGVPRHHWRFGSMPPVPGVTKTEVTSIIAYVRELQVANGIKYRRHQM